MQTENESPHKMYWPFEHKVYYEGDTDENNRNKYESQSYNDDLVKNLDK